MSDSNNSNRAFIMSLFGIKAFSDFTLIMEET